MTFISAHVFFTQFNGSVGGAGVVKLGPWLFDPGGSYAVATPTYKCLGWGIGDCSSVGGVNARRKVRPTMLLAARWGQSCCFNCASRSVRALSRTAGRGVVFMRNVLIFFYRRAFNSNGTTLRSPCSDNRSHSSAICHSNASLD